MMQWLRSKRKILLVLLMLFFVAVLVTIVIISGLQKPQSTTMGEGIDIVEMVATVPSGYPQEVSFSSGEVRDYKPDDVVILFPAGALQRTSSVKISSRNPNILSVSAEPEWQHPIVVNLELLDGNGDALSEVEFIVPIEVCFVLNDARWTQFWLNPERYRVDIYNKEMTPAAWEPLPIKAYSERRLLCGQTTRLSLFALAEYTAVPLPVTGGTSEPYKP